MENSIPWIEKYRPGKIDDIIMEKNIEDQIKLFLVERDNIHLILTGLPGVGKTSTVKCIAKKLLGPYLNEGYLELNAADDRGIKSIDVLIPTFCRKSVPFTQSKIILLDEADNMTSKCQYDINSSIKKYGKKTKFIFTCNDSSKIVEDIQSVCHIVHLKKLSEPQIYNYLRKICEAEGVKYQKSGLELVCSISDGDMRKAINNLQIISYSYKIINKKNVLLICQVPDPEKIKIILELCMEQDFNGAIEELEKIMESCHYYSDIITGFYHTVNKMNLKDKLEILDIVFQTKITFSVGTRSKLQIIAMVARIIKILKRPEEPKLIVEEDNLR